MKWCINQRIVAIVDHRQGLFKKGDEFIIKGLRNSICKCKEIDINIGIESMSSTNHCPVCKSEWLADAFMWFSETRFAPLEENTETTELSEVLVSPNGDILEPETA